ncbi:MAG: site-specific integrase [Desulfovibrio sp.]|nr:site-specific integrase [Desulfovibrio sp.]
MPKRVKVDGYVGVYYMDGLKRGSKTETERIYYITYRRGGRESKVIEERAGRASDGMTAARANQLRTLRITGKELSNAERRVAAAEAKRLEEERLNRPTFDRLWLLYDEGNAQRSTRRADEWLYRRKLQDVFGQKTPDELCTPDIDRFRCNLEKTGLGAQSVKHTLAMIRRIINYAVKKGVCRRPDLEFEMPKVDGLKTENMTREQMAAYLAALDAEPDQNAAAVIRLILVTGIRRGAAFALEWRDIDFERGFITLRGEHAKSGRTEKIPMSAAARAVLENVHRTPGSEYVFPGRNGKKRADFKRVPLRVRDKAGLAKDFRPLHGLRHTFASWMASTGAVDLYTLQKLLTHNSPQMTQRYAHLSDEAMQRAAAVAGDVFRAVAGEEAKAHALKTDGTPDE